MPLSFIVSLYVLDRNTYNEAAKPKPDTTTTNPYKGKRRVKDDELIPVDITQKYMQEILDLVLYDVENCEALRNFETVQYNTHCIFSKKAVLWGARDYKKEFTIGEFGRRFHDDI